jgi:hypothetical protein
VNYCSGLISFISYFQDKICRAFVAGKCTFGETCKFSHKPAEIWKTRESDLGPILNMQCPIFEKFGYCHYDISCRFADTHVTFNEDGTYVNKKAEETKQIFDVERNRINSSWQVMMRDNRFNFPKTRAAMEGVSLFLFHIVFRPKKSTNNIQKFSTFLLFFDFFFRILSLTPSHPLTI